MVTQSTSENNIMITPVKIVQKNSFTAYKVSVDGRQFRWGYIHDLTKACVDKLLRGIQTDPDFGDYTWSYGISRGRKV